MKKWMCAMVALAVFASAGLTEPVVQKERDDVGLMAAQASPAPKQLPEGAKRMDEEAPAKEAHDRISSGASAQIPSATFASESPARGAESLTEEKPDVAASAAPDAASASSDGEVAAPGASVAESEKETSAAGGADEALDATPGETENADAPGEADASPEAGVPGEANTSPEAGTPGEATPSPEAGAQGDVTPSPEASAPTSAEPSAEVTANPGDPTEAPAEPEGYALVGEEKKQGTLAELLAEAGEKTIYLQAKEPVTIPEFKLALLQKVTLLPAPKAFPEENPGELYAVKLMDGEVEIKPDDINNATADKHVNLIVSVVEAEPEEPVDPSAIKLTVTPRDYTPDTWMNWNPEFKLSGIPKGSEGYSYVAVIYDERFVPLSGDFYYPLEEGAYTVRFAIMDDQGDVVSSSDAYSLKLDFTPPKLSIQVSESSDYTMSLSATDEPGGAAQLASGVAEFSLDGGITWSPLGEGETVTHSETRKKTFPPKTILVRDLAGNVSGNEAEIVLDKLPDNSFGGWGGGGGASKPTVPHASGDGDDSPYASYELALPDGAVDVLTLGGEEIDLGLAVDGSPGERFTAKLDAWAREDAVAEPAKDTLVVRAEADGASSARTFDWRVNGSVLRKLYNSDIRYLALAAGDAVLSLPTEGFTAGTRYAELKMGGVSTSEFEYEITMRTGEGHPLCDWNVSTDCDVEIAVVVGGERFDMADRETTPEMYVYDVYCGPEDLPNYPYGAYPGME